MDWSLVSALVGAAAAVAAVLVAILQLRQDHSAHGVAAVGRDRYQRKRLGSAADGNAQAVLPPPVGRLPAVVRGRAGIVEELAVLARHPDGRVHVLAGLGGSGKSTVALAVARDSAGAGLRAWWVAIADAGSVTSALLGLARKLGAPDGEVAEALAGRVNPSDVLWPRLEAAPGWVLVLDNADEPAVLAAAGRRAGEAAG